MVVSSPRPVTLNRAGAILRALRPHQWTKNLLVFLPLLLAHQLFDPRKLVLSAAAFVAFCAIASAIYIVNDLVDREADRLHPSKRRRPFAAGHLTAGHGAIAVLVLLTLAIAVALFLPWSANAFLATYGLFSLAYSLFWKQILFLDVVLLTGFYCLRILFGGAATSIVISIWTMAFSMFLFLTLALVKRAVELKQTIARDQATLTRRAYVASDLPQIASFGSASSYMAVLVMALYINSPDVLALYRRPAFLWLTCPLLIYWTSRIWILTNRGEMHEDPVLFALKDRVSYVVGVALVAIVAAAI